jgi:competence ComEA-like helix-hairpin-helix protein
MPESLKQKSSSKLRFFLTEWFSFFSSERLGITTLIIILLFVIILPRFFKNDEISTEDVEALKKEMDVFLAGMETKPAQIKLDTLFMFDPNTVDSASLVLLGFSPRQAKSIVNYRNKGGKFYDKESFGKSFVVSEEMFTRLYYHIDIKPVSRPAKGDVQKKPASPKIASSPAVKTSDSENKPETTVKKVYTIEINTADITELQKFYGIGEYYAKKIVDYRSKLGGFYKAEQLMEISGIDSVRFAQFVNQIAIDAAHIKRIKINAAQETELSKHPYINNYTAKAIIKYRKFKGTISSGNEMIKEKVITEEQLKKISAYLEY